MCRQPDQPELAALGREMLNFALDVEQAHTPQAVIDRLHDCTSRFLDLRMLGAVRFPLRLSDWQLVEKGRDAFLHRDVPEGWWEEYWAISRSNHDVGLMMARASLSPCTWTERRLLLEPTGVDRWTYDLALKYGMRDGYTCPVGGRWVLTFWSKRVLNHSLTPEARVIVFMGANFAAIRMEQLIGPNPNRLGAAPRLTPREQSVLRLFACGMPLSEVAEALGLGQETVRSHIKKAQTKLGVRNRTQAVAEALRQQFFP